MTQSCSSPNSNSNKSYSSLIPRFKWPAVPKRTCLPQSPPLVSSFTTDSAYPFPSPPPTLPMPWPVPPNRQRTTSTSSIDTICSKQNFSTLDELVQFYGRSEPPSPGVPVKSKRKQCNRTKSSNKAKQRKAKRTSSPSPATTCLASVLHSDHRIESAPSTPEVGAATVPNYQAWAESSTPVGDDASVSNCDSQSPWSPSPSSIYRWHEIDPFVPSPANPQFDRNSGFDHAARTLVSTPLNGHDDSPIHMHYAAPTVDDFELSIVFLQQPHFEFWDKHDAEHVVCPAQLHLTLKDPHELHDLHLHHHHGQQSFFTTSLPDIQVIDVECSNTPVPSLLTDHDPDANYRIAYIGSMIHDDGHGVGVGSGKAIPKGVLTKPGICIHPNWSRLHFDEGWFMNLWVPIPTRLFAKKETRSFTLRSRLWIGKEDEEPEAVVGERVMTVSHLLRERHMI